MLAMSRTTLNKTKMYAQRKNIIVVDHENLSPSDLNMKEEGSSERGVREKIVRIRVCFFIFYRLRPGHGMAWQGKHDMKHKS